MKIELFTTVHYLEIQPRLDGFYLREFLIVQDYRELGPLLDPDLINALGIIHKNQIENNPVMYLMQYEVDDFVIGGEGDMWTEIISTLLLCFWFIKDNSISNAAIFIREVEPNPKIVLRYPNRTYNAKGEISNTVYNRDELNSVFMLIPKIINLRTVSNLDFFEKTGLSDMPMPLDVQYHPELFTKVYRALTHLETLRETKHISRKIFHYVAILECLFTRNEPISMEKDINNCKKNVSNEKEKQFNIAEPVMEKVQSITSMVRQRVVSYLGGNLKEKKEIANNITVAYDIRSKYVHGQAIPGKLMTKTSQIKYALRMDSLVRVIFNKIILTDLEFFLLPEDEFESYIKSKINP